MPSRPARYNGDALTCTCRGQQNWPSRRRVAMASPTLQDHLEGSCVCPRGQRVALTSPLLDHLEGSCACPGDRRVAKVTRSPRHVEDGKTVTMTCPRDRRVAKTCFLFAYLEGSCSASQRRRAAAHVWASRPARLNDVTLSRPSRGKLCLPSRPACHNDNALT